MKKEYNQRYYQEHKKKIDAMNKLYLQEHPEQQRKKIERDRLRRKNSPEVAERARESNRKWRRNHPDRNKKSLASWKLATKTEVLTHYGGGKLYCVMCGFDDLRALSIDHIHDNGAEERRHNKHAKSGGVNFYLWLRKQGYPEGYQTLCMNCQLIKRDFSKGLLDKLKRGVGKE